MALPTVAELEQNPELASLKAILQASQVLRHYAAQSDDYLRTGQMNSLRANTYLKTLQGHRDTLAAQDPTVSASLLAVLSPKGDDLVAEHAALLAETDKRIAEFDAFLTDSGLKTRELSPQEANALRVKLGASARG